MTQHHGDPPLHITSKRLEYITPSINNLSSDTKYNKHKLHTTLERSNQHDLVYEGRSRHVGTPQHNYSYQLEQYINT
jgi:hypothetical protein